MRLDSSRIEKDLLGSLSVIASVWASVNWEELEGGGHSSSKRPLRLSQDEAVEVVAFFMPAGCCPSPIERRCAVAASRPAGYQAPHYFANWWGGISITPLSGAGGNRTPVHQAMSVRDTTIPDFETDAISPTGRMFPIARKPRHVFACGQRTFSRSAFFLAVIPRFCCRAAVDRPRAPFLVTMSLYNLRIRRQERIAGWQFCFCPV